jgi:YbbR domain-containing protein
MKRPFPDFFARAVLFKDTLRGYLVEHPGLKLLAGLITLVLWLSVSMQPISETTLRLPITFQNVPRGYSVIDQDVDSVQVKVKGPNDILSRVRSGAVHLDTIIDLSGYLDRPGKRVVTLSSDNVSTPATVQAIDVTPSRISITLAQSTEKTVPIRPLFDGSPAPGYSMSDFRIDPATIKVRGAQNRLDQIDVAHTETILLTNRSSDFDTQVAIDVHDPSIEITQPTAKVHVIIVKAISEVTLDNVPVKIGTQLQTVKVTLEGNGESLKSIKPSDLITSVDPTKIDRDRMARVQVTVPKEYATNVTVKKVEPERVLIKNR